MVICLICDKEVAKEQLFAHLCQELLYTRNRCSDCPLRSYNSAEMYAHANETGHCVVLNEAWSGYKENLVRKLYADCFNNPQKEGKEAEVRAQYLVRQQASSSVSGGVAPSTNSYTPMDAAFLTSLARGTPEVVSPIQEDAEMVHDSNRQASAPSNQLATTSPVHYSPVVEVIPEAGYAIEVDAPSDVLGAVQDQQRVGCRVCRTADTIENDYSGHRSHVYEAHPPPLGVRISQEQGHIAAMIRACFPTATVFNDLTCHFEGCGAVVKFGSRGAKGSQEDHVRSAHVSATLTCPVDDCAYTILRPDTGALRRHLKFQKEHGGVNNLVGEEKERHKRQRDELRLKVAPIFKRCFPFLPGETNAQCATRKAGDSASTSTISDDDNKNGGDEAEKTEPRRKRTFMTFPWQ